MTFTTDTPEDLSCLSYWFPRLLTSDVPVPKTEIIRARGSLAQLTDGIIPLEFDQLVDDIGKAAARQRYPCFLRTGHTSGKHQWRTTCYLESPHDIAEHVYNLCEFSAIADAIGLPTDIWVVRELLPTNATLHTIGGLPITRERRYFIRNGAVDEHGPYWTAEALAININVDGWQEQLSILNQETDEEREILEDLTEQVARVFPGYWSVDWMLTSDRGWVCIDMAEGDKSYRLHNVSLTEQWGNMVYGMMHGVPSRGRQAIEEWQRKRR